MRLRRLLLFAALAGVVGFLLLDRPSSAPDSPAAKAAGAAPQAGPTESLDVPGRRGLARARGELFAAPPPPPQAQVARASVGATAPLAPPPVPYRFAGRVLKGSEEEVLISKGDLVFPVKVGDTLDGMYKVESIGADRIELLYLPLGTRDHIVVGSVLDVQPVASTPAAPATATAPVIDRRPALQGATGRAIPHEQPASFRTAIQ